MMESWIVGGQVPNFEPGLLKSMKGSLRRLIL